MLPIGKKRRDPDARSGNRCDHPRTSSVAPQRRWPDKRGGRVMTRLRSRVLAAAGAVAAAGTLAFAGVTAATASTSGGAGHWGIEHFQLMSTSATSSTQSIIAYGKVFTAGGVDHSGNTVDRVVFPD